MKISNSLPIFTKYIGPSAARGSRISVRYDGQPATMVSWDHSLGMEQNHINAKEIFCEKFKLNQGGWVGAETNTGYVFVKL